MQRPPLGLTIRCELIEVLDGRTVRVRVDLPLTDPEFEIRILGVNTPNVRGDEMALGLASAQALQNLIQRGELTLHMPLGQFFDPQDTPVDCNLFIGEKDVAQELSSLGYGTLVGRTARELGLEE